MSTNSDYKQYLRKYRVIVTTKTVTSAPKAAKTGQTTPEVPAVPDTTTMTGVVTGGTVNFRKGPGTKYKSYGTKKKGTKLKEIIQKSNGWYQFKEPKGSDGTAWMSGKYVKITGTKTALQAVPKAGEKTVEEAVPKAAETAGNGGNALDVSGLRCVFVCEKSLNDTPNYSQITIYNLNQQTISNIKAGDKVILEAGYDGGNYGMIFTGDIVQPMVHRESSTDIALTLIVQDGDMYLNSAFTAQTLSKASTQGDVIAACLNSDVSKGAITEALPKTAMVRGKVLFGKSAKYLKKVAANSKSQFYIEDGKVNIVAATDYASNQAVELNPITGLIGMPEQTDDGVKGQCLINPSIKLNTLIYINSKAVRSILRIDRTGRPTRATWNPKGIPTSQVTQKQVGEGETNYSAVNADGVYRIVKLTIEGDTHGDQWYMTFEAITQSGAKPTGMSDGETNPWR